MPRVVEAEVLRLDRPLLPGAKAAVVGLGVSNLALTRFLLRHGARVTACDQNGPALLGDGYRELVRLREEGAPLSLHLGPGYLDHLAGHDYIFLTPGMKKNLPQVEEARAGGARVSSETRLFLRLCRAPVAGVTGSAGKTTTTTLVGEMLKAAGVTVVVGGNIGRPLIEEVENIGPDAWVVMELSSFQLELVDRSPRVAALLNISPNHLDVHAGMEEYVAAKRNIFRFQGSGDWSVLNHDQAVTREMAAEAASRVAFFSLRRLPPGVETGAFVAGGSVIIRVEGQEERVCAVRDIRLRGRHNLANVLAAAIMSTLVGVGPRPIREVAAAFRGVEHRLEPVRELGGIRFYNDSIATAPDRTMAALAAFREPLVLIAGGYDKKLPFDALGRAVRRRVKCLVLLGATADKIEKAVREAKGKDGTDVPSIRRARDLEEAVLLAWQEAAPGDVVLLSPACASYDMFRNFEERGRRFREIVQALPAGGRR